MKINTDHLQAEADRIEKIVTESPYTNEELDQAKKDHDAICKTEQGFKLLLQDCEFSNDISEKMSMLIEIGCLARYQETLNSDLMKVDTKYVITETKSLVSPAGFPSDSRVFMQTKIAIHTDNKKELVPKTDFPLYLHVIK